MAKSIERLMIDVLANAENKAGFSACVLTDETDTPPPASILGHTLIIDLRTKPDEFSPALPAPEPEPLSLPAAGLQYLSREAQQAIEPAFATREEVNQRRGIERLSDLVINV